MKKIKGGDIVVLTSGQMIKLGNENDAKDSFKGNCVIFKRGSIGKVMGISEDNGEIVCVTVGFSFYYGIALQTTVLPNDIRKATSDEIHCFCGYNNQSLS